MPRKYLRCLLAATLFATGITPAAAAANPTTTTTTGSRQKVMVIVEENHTYGEIIGSRQAPYLNALARTYGNAVSMTANYPVRCPSLAAYILITSGSTGGICDDQGPSHHPLRIPSIFSQLDAAHRPWRNYDEDLPEPCASQNNGLFLVRHTAVPYYVSESRACESGQADLTRLPRDLAAGTLPDYSLVIPNSCDDMHGAPACPTDLVPAGDRWLRTWMPRILHSSDFKAGRLVVIVTWDEGSSKDNHIPTLVISAGTHGVRKPTAFDHCSTLRTTEDLLRLPLLGCARSAASMVQTFGLR